LRKIYGFRNDYLIYSEEVQNLKWWCRSGYKNMKK